MQTLQNNFERELSKFGQLALDISKKPNKFGQEWLDNQQNRVLFYAGNLDKSNK